MKHPDNVDDKPAPTELTESSEYQEAMGLEKGDIFVSTGRYNHPTKVKYIDYDITVCDPTVDHPQDARYGSWDINISDLYMDWYLGDIVPAKLSVEVNEVTA